MPVRFGASVKSYRDSNSLPRLAKDLFIARELTRDFRKGPN